MEAVRDRIASLLKQEEGQYSCPHYLSSDKDSNAASSGIGVGNGGAQNEAQLVDMVAECANLVTDPLAAAEDSKENKGSAPSPNSVVKKSPSAVSVRELNHMHSNGLEPSSSQQASSAGERVEQRRNFGYWRQQMFDWACMVVDSFQMDREVVAMSFNILDRFVAKEMAYEDVQHHEELRDTLLEVEQITRDDFQLYAMTCLYLSVKIMEPYPRKLGMEALVDMSRGFYTEQDIAVTELEILMALGWHVHPPTAVGFCRLLWQLFPVQVSKDFCAACVTMTEVAVSTSSFVGYKPSLIGLAACLHAGHLSGMSDETLLDFLKNVNGLIRTHGNADFDTVYIQLHKLYC